MSNLVTNDEAVLPAPPTGRARMLRPLRWLLNRRAKTRRRRIIFRTCWLVFFLAAACYCGPQYHLKRYQEVRAGALYRTGQPTEWGLWYLIRGKGVKTVLSTQLYDIRLRRGIVDPGKASGRRESEYVAQLGARHRQWPMGEEACWPWVTPWQFEEFFRLFDDPDSLPVALHCAGGRHRTGTVAALYRLEFDRWTADQTIKELHSFEFGEPVPIQEHNLRTYLPRPRPSIDEWNALRDAFAGVITHAPPTNYDDLVRQLRKTIADDSQTQLAVVDYLNGDQPFAICLAQRLMEDPGHSMQAPALQLAGKVLVDLKRSSAEWSMAAALIADFGDATQQQRLIELLGSEPRAEPPTSRYQAAVAGVTNRYTPNRIPFLRPLLDDERQRPEPGAARYRYCDTAVVRLSSIINQNLLVSAHSLDDRDGGRQRAREWFTAEGTSIQLARLLPPTGDNQVLPGDPPGDGELLRNRR